MPDSHTNDPSQQRPGGHGGVAGKKRARTKPKGRMVDPAAMDEVAAILGQDPSERDMLIEYLHLIQDSAGHLSQRHLTALAAMMKLPMAEVWEVATFYDHFDCIKDGDTPPAPVTVRVCDGLSCQLGGAEALLAELADLDGADVRIKRAPCIGACDKAPAAALGQQLIPSADRGVIEHVLANGAPTPDAAQAVLFDAYCADGGYSTLKQITSGEMTADQVIDKLGETALRGLGGAGFPTARKWSIVRSYEGPRLMAVNGDEGEPGTFKDRYYMSRDPHRMLEGMLIGAFVVEASDVYIYMRDEYPEIIALLREEIARVEAAGLADHTRIHLRRGAGAYICGEESAMIESIEGKRGLPRHRPPYVAEQGLFNRPTLVNNLETLFWIRDLLEKGGDWFNSQGKDNHPGFRSYSVSGRVANPGVVVAPAGSSVNELIERCGGMAEGHSFKGYLPGGASGGILPAAKGDIPLDFGGELAEEGCFVGSHAVVVLSDQDNIRDAALNLLSFFAHESCGQCTPCRNGTEKAVMMLNAPSPDKTLLGEVSVAMADASICGLGQAASNPLVSVMKHFPEDMDAPLPSLKSHKA
ncbi:MAG: NAD(P)H-dependent oxidoreductase subunit E [Alphaproteobacteria bacterium]|nr:NAD(P)H-dependent oxidoreductase subunit E [Alphaproteobacteria bacterium]